MPFWPRGFCSLLRRLLTARWEVETATSRRSPASSLPCSESWCWSLGGTIGCIWRTTAGRRSSARVHGRALPPLREGRHLREPSLARDVSQPGADPAGRRCRPPPTRRRSHAGVRSPRPGSASSGTTTASTGRVRSRRRWSVERRTRYTGSSLARSGSCRRHGFVSRLSRLPANAPVGRRSAGHHGWGRSSSARSLAAVALGAGARRTRRRAP